MEQKSYWKCFLDPVRLTEKTQFNAQRGCGLHHTESCRKEAQNWKYPSHENLSVQESLRLFRQLLAEDACSQCMPMRRSHTCCSRDFHRTFSLIYTSWCPEVSKRHFEEEIHGTSRSCGNPFQLSESCMCAVHARPQAVSTLTRLREVLKLIFALENKMSHQDCLFSRENEECEPELKKCYGCFMAGTDEHNHGLNLEDNYESHHGGEAWDEDLNMSISDVQCDQQQDQTHLTSIRKLKNSLKTDLLRHQIVLASIKTRLSGIEQRADDVTRDLEKANLELEALKQNHHNVTNKNHPTYRQAFTDRLDLEIWECQEENEKTAPLWNDVFQQKQVGYPVMDKFSPKVKKANRRNQRSLYGVQPNVYESKDRIEVLMRQVNKQINKIENEITSNIKKKMAVDKKMVKNIIQDPGQARRSSAVPPIDMLDLQELLSSKLKAQELGVSWN